ncbi:hypothetical protein BXZ70DRAFT_911131 [Cristinia sonorae]|uniref:Uncharacterized protein n=1 Tax=Cristinia sonorae TaxID=1940300 RepID=A0A8K0XK53_9AGAR|nr:hypothetical protein BXZ70DRAFT_911131 [Cristinia sonorae]
MSGPGKSPGSPAHPVKDMPAHQEVSSVPLSIHIHPHHSLSPSYSTRPIFIIRTVMDTSALVFNTTLDAILADPSQSNPFNINVADPIVLYGTDINQLFPNREYCTFNPSYTLQIHLKVSYLEKRIIAAMHSCIHYSAQLLFLIPFTPDISTIHSLGLRVPRIFSFLTALQHKNRLTDQMLCNNTILLLKEYLTIGWETVQWLHKSITIGKARKGQTLWAWDRSDALERRVYAINVALGAVEYTQGSTAMMVHPTYGSTAHNEIVPYSPLQPHFTEPALTTPASRALVIHPLWSSNAKNQFTLYNSANNLDEDSFESMGSPTLSSVSSVSSFTSISNDSQFDSSFRPPSRLQVSNENTAAKHLQSDDTKLSSCEQAELLRFIGCHTIYVQGLTTSGLNNLPTTAGGEFIEHAVN